MAINERYVNGTAVLSINGPIRGESVKAIVKATRAYVRTARRIVILDLTRVPSVDLGGLGGLLEAHATMRGCGGQLRLAGVTKGISDLVVITRLLTVFDTYDSVDEAINGAAACATPMSSISARGLGVIQRFLRQVQL